MENMNHRDKYCYWKYVLTVFYIENSSCPFSIKCFLRVTLFDTPSQTFARLDVPVCTSTDKSLDRCEMHFCPCGSLEDKSAVTWGDNSDFNLEQAVCAQLNVQPNPPLSHKQVIWQRNVVCLSLEGHDDGSQGHFLAPLSLMAVRPGQKINNKIPVCAWDS